MDGEGQGPAPELPIKDLWVDQRYIEDAGVGQRLRDQGYQLYWSAANDEARRVNLEGWEVVGELDDGRLVRYKIRDHPVIGGYLVLLKKKEES